MTDHFDGNQEQRSSWRRARYLAEVFGEVLPETTSDERRADTGGENESERWHQENRPPHHDR